MKLKFFIYFFLTVSIIALALIQPIHEDNFLEEEYYSNTSDRIKNIDPLSQQSTEIKIGWSRINFTPPQPSEFAGYSGRGKYTSVKDSVFANCTFINTPKGNYAILNFELILVHQTFSTALEESLLSDSTLNLKDIYYTCSHTHSSFGGWAEGLLAKFVLGGHEPEIVDFMVEQTKNMVLQAQKNTSKVEMAYKTIQLKYWVINRIDKNSEVDDILRLLIFKNETGEKSALISFSAHPTFIPLTDRFLTGDFPGMVTQQLVDSLDLKSLSYVSGAIGSTSANDEYRTYEHATTYANRLIDTLLPNFTDLDFKPITNFNYNKVAIDLPDPQFKINNDIGLRSFWFQFVFGDPQAQMACLELNNINLFGISGEISGETFDQVTSNLSSQNQQYIPTSFNGDYIGYLTKSDHYYSRESSETRDMNLYGPKNSDYFVQVISEFLNHIH